MKIMIVDDSELFLNRLERILSENKNIEVVAKVSDSANAIEILNAVNPDVVILDIRMRGINGIELLKMIKKESSQTIVIMLSNYDPPIYRSTCLLEGAEYFLDKSTEFDNVMDICDKLLLTNAPDKGEKI